LSKNLYLDRKNTINALILSIVQKRWENRFLVRYHYCAKRRRSRLELIIAGKVEQTVRFSFIATIISTKIPSATKNFKTFFRQDRPDNPVILSINIKNYTNYARF